MHMFPQLRKLEKKYEKELVVIGVHSAKFPSERVTQNVRKAILRYEIEHPVVNDKDFRIWRAYVVRAWPTLILIDPRGRIIARHEGEIRAEAIDGVLASLIAAYDDKKLLDRTPLKLKLERDREREGLLSFPGKVLADGAGGQLFISDSNHNRLLVVSLSDGTIQQVIGSGQMGLKDGDFQSAQFNHPQGMALDGDILYVADTENHAIRKIDLKAQTVETIAGTGEQAWGERVGGEGKTTPLSSPWDLVALNGKLYICMAGFHQLWAMDLKTNQVYPFAGSGYEGLRDGPMSLAWLAQPSGITTDGQRLYFADSETSSIRIADVNENGRVRTIVGVDLFEFGDIDGTGQVVRLQHPLGVCYQDGIIYVADTYNNKIKRVFPNTRSAMTFLGTGEAGYKDGNGDEAKFHEPGGLSVANGKLYIADTNNHAIRVADLQTRQVKTLELKERSVR